ncbi:MULTISPECIES: DUF1488 domain-containing protein [Rhizobium/Agrobacterium group]|uniref:DUF1488 domain-containing protein n=1 Tax=Rhizobium rhizogenes TaxID=359 RepID=A0AA92H8C2_RHIRH|nr:MULTISPECIES: DUF1488 domain-containing protein [Rhizobium/Agrobacterium group]KRA05295.1 hypothetical protein ASD74_02005 [Rhizobium sp. Root564]PVE51468.1 DUF1488 domain-containing protein [Rhizobium rhizogenes]PVE67403.1 DUF1488 domain-containing protein [Agrobacterium tumefaciens]PVE77180.1 DUF1488 domain-containing protein [Sphingomonas sp. TPD3009]
MGISFPNKARSFDDRKRCVRFTGYDGMFEIKFYLATEVLAQGKSSRNVTEADYLMAFDALRPRILQAATSAYSKVRSSVITLDLAHFR